ncbi:DUF6178 family protein [Candidatus Binatia bacterium]|nr:DUF6178 family protein [Candidatus Binatia bacterium]
MADLGFADYYEALEVYRYLDPRRVVLPADAAPAHFGEPATPCAGRAES